MYFVGIDWADQKYDVTIVDQDGNIILQNMTIKKSHDGFEKLLDKLRRISDNPHDFKIGIETPHNLLVDFLINLGYWVFSILTGSMKSFRKRYRSSSARDDQFDSYVLADVLRTDKKCWRQIDFGSESVREIRLLVQDHHTLVEQQIALSNRLRSTLKEYYPEYIHFFSDVACPTSLAFIRAYPEFDLASKLTREQLADFFEEHRFRNGKTINKIYHLLHQPHLIVPDELVRVRQLKATSYARRLVALASDIAQYRYLLKQLVAQHPDSQIFLSYPGVADITAARLLALFGDNREFYTDVSELQALAGTCPVTEKSGNCCSIYYRIACNKFYRDVIHKLAFSSLTKAQWAKTYYQNHRAMGKKHNHALRCLGNLHLKILFAMWKNRTQYDENVFLAQRARHLIANQK